MGEAETMEESSGGGEIGGLEGEDVSEMFPGFPSSANNFSTFNTQVGLKFGL